MKASAGIFFIAATALLFALAVVGHSAVPQTVNYQGYLTDAGGNPVDGTLSMTFRIYNVSAGGAVLWTETQVNVHVSNGMYNVVLGSVNPINLLFNEQYYLGIQVVADSEMTPRQQLTGVPYAMRAKEADDTDTVDGQHASAFATSGHTHTTGTNIFVGENAGDSNTTGGSNSFIGPSAGSLNTDGNFNTFVGSKAGGANVSGSYNTFLGSAAGGFNTSAHENTFIGYGAGNHNTAGGNTFLGSGTGQSNSSGDNNTFAGRQAGNFNTTGRANVFLGSDAGRANTEGSFNTFVGTGAGYSNTTSPENTFLGNSAGSSNTTGGSNTFVGKSSGFANTIGSGNTFIGRQTGLSNTTGSGNVFIGDNAGYNETGSNKLYIDNSTTSVPLIYGDFGADTLTVNGKVGIGTTTPAANLHIAGKTLLIEGQNPSISLNTQTGTLQSAIEFKHNNSPKWSIFTDAGGYGLNNLSFTDMAADSTRLFINDAGNVGIGTTSPAQKLSVAGTIESTSGGIKFPDGTIQASASAGGDITGVNHGTGLTGGGTSGDVTLQADTTYLQRRLSSSCIVGSSIRVINEDGTVVCETDDGNAYAAGTGLNLSGLTFNLNVPLDLSGADTGGIIRGANTGEGHGGYFEASGTNSHGVYGKASNTGYENNYGGYFVSNGFSSAGVAGSASGQQASGVRGFSTGSTASAVAGYASGPWGKGIYGEASYAGDYKNYGGYFLAAGSTGIGVYGKNNAQTGYAGYFDGNVKVAGNFIVTGSAVITPPSQNPRNNSLWTVDSAGDVGRDTSMTIGTDGLPVVSYYDATNYNLKVVKCGNASCSSGNTITPNIDTDYGEVGWYTSISIGTDGLPVISYLNVMETDLRVAKCGNASCSSGNTLYTVDPGVDSWFGSGAGIASSITIGTDGRPIISYYDTLDDLSVRLKVVKCGNASCSSGNTITIVDYYASNYGGANTSIAIGTDGLPIVAYLGSGLKVVKCGNASCSSGNTITTMDSSGNVGYYTSITIGTDGLPVISYYDSTNYDLKVAKCGNASCSSGNTITTVDSSGNVGLYTSITIGTDGLPIISYRYSSGGDLKIAKCGNVSCSYGNTIITVDSAVDVGLYTSITIGTDGLPVIAYFDDTFDDLKVAKCANQFCLNNWSRR
ncbi:MAG: hypothetical protein HZA16_09640 [Nitrospirae bacterium]|nr:hypothetical protein [Nitrospirota bacterium]